MKRSTLFSLILTMVLFIVAPALKAQSTAAGDKIVGTYYVKDDQSPEEAKIKIYRTTAGTYAGKTIWVKNPNFKDGTPKRDIKNPDPKKRNTPANQITMLFHFKYDANKKEWVDGEIYDPIHGKYYKCKMWFSDSKTLNLRGYIGIPALGRTMKWTKIS